MVANGLCPTVRLGALIVFGGCSRNLSMGTQEYPRKPVVLGSVHVRWAEPYKDYNRTLLSMNALRTAPEFRSCSCSCSLPSQDSLRTFCEQLTSDVLRSFWDQLALGRPPIVLGTATLGRSPIVLGTVAPRTSYDRSWSSNQPPPPGRPIGDNTL